MLEIKGLHARAGDAEILKGLDLVVGAGEVHAIMGPNGSGKSTLANVLSGRPSVEVTAGRVLYQGRDLLELAPEDRAKEGIFLAFQYPVEIPGVSNAYFMRPRSMQPAPIAAKKNSTGWTSSSSRARR
jgi:Fe-S cluster assembly ATP-binding protein